MASQTLDLSELEKGAKEDASKMQDARSLIDLAAEGTVEVIREPTAMRQWNKKLEQVLGVEARGVDRVPEDERSPEVMRFLDYVQMAIVWFSANVTLNNIVIGLLGPISYELGIVDSMVIGTFGTMLGCLCVAYMATFGPISGNRTLVIARYTMGWWPGKLAVLLNIVIMLGYGLVDCLFAGQVLSAVANGSMSVIVGIIIAALISLVVAIFGIKVFHTYERFAWIPQLIVCFILIGVAGPYFDVTVQSVGTSDVVIADRLSFFFLAASVPLAWSPAGADFFVYYPPSASRPKIFASVFTGITLACVFMLLIGAGIGTGVLSNTEWSDAYDVSAGTLMVQVLSPLGGFGYFCAVVLSLGLISNNIPGQYSAALSFQLLGSWFKIIPRFIWVFVGTVIYTVLACVGRNQFFTIFEDFLALMGYWVFMWIIMTIEEEFIFRRRYEGHWYNWEVWNNPEALPIGIAALICFLIGWVGAVLCMWQIYFTGPIASLVGDGIDLGMPVSGSWVAILYPPLRYLELKKFER